MSPQTSRRGCPDRRRTGRDRAAGSRGARHVRRASAGASCSPDRPTRPTSAAGSWPTPGSPRSRRSGLPAFVPTGRARARVAFGAPLSVGLVAEAELADIVLTEFEPTWRVRDALVAQLPVGWRLVDLYDVWLGAPPLAGQVIAADYRIDVAGAAAAEIAAAAAALLAADRLPRERQKGATTVAYDLRPLVADLGVVAAGPPVVIRAGRGSIRNSGTGRPAEVVAALGDPLGTSAHPRASRP